MAATFVDYNGNQGTGTNNADFGFSFPSFKKQDIKVEVDNDIKTLDTHYQINTYNVVSGGTVTFTAGNIPSLATQEIRIYRETDVATDSGDYDPKAVFQAGSSIKADDLNNNIKQALFAAREQQEQTVQTHEIKNSAVTEPKVKDGSVTTNKIATGAVTSAKIGNNQVNSQHYVNNSIDTIHYAALSVNNSALGVDAVNGNKIADNSIDSEHYVDGSINTQHIANAQITHDKLGANCIDGDNIQDNVINSEHYFHGSIDTEHIANENITTAKLEPNAVTSAKLADNAVLTANVTDLNITTAKIAHNAVTEGKLGAYAVTTGKIAAYNVDTINIANNAITHVKLANDSVDGDNIQDNSINSEHYVNGSIDTAHIADDAVTSGKVADNSIGTQALADGAVTTSQLGNNVVTTAKIADDAITNLKISAAAVSTTELTNNSVTAAKIQDAAVTTAKIQDTAVTTAKIANDNITTAKIADDAVTNEKIADGALDGRYYTESELDAGQLDNRYFTEAESDARYFNISSGDTIKDGDTFPDNDTTIATTAAINDRIIDLVDDVGGFVPIANEISFPNANPDVNNGAGTLVSIKALSQNLTSNGSGEISISNGTVGNSTVTITGADNNTTYTASFGMIVETTTTLNTYTFHRLVPKATEVSTVSGSISNVNTVAGAISNVNSVASNATNINTVAGINANVTTVAGISGNVTTVANNNANVTAVAGKATEITRLGTADAVADLAILGTTDAVADMNTLATTAIVSDMDTLADISSNITTVAGISSNVTTVANNNSNVTAVADNASNINSAVANASNINSAVSNASNINSAVSNASNINSAVSNASNINTVAGSISNVNTAATNIASINTTASNIADVNNFTDRYQVASSDPSTDGGGNALAAGDLYFNTSADELKVYTGSAWQGGVTATGDFAVTTGNTFTGDNTYNDNVKAKFGTGSDLEIYHDGSQSVIKDNGTGQLLISGENTIALTNANATETYGRFLKNDAVELYYDNSKKFETTTSGVSVTGNIVVNGNVDGRDISADGTKLDGIETGATADQTASEIVSLLSNQTITANGLIMTDNKSILLGASDDFRIRHTGNHSDITDEGTGNLRLGSNKVIIGSPTFDETSATFTDDGAVELYHNNVKKVETTSTGITVSGTEHKFTSGTSGDCEVIIEADTDNNNENDNPRLIFRQDGGIDVTCFEQVNNKLTISNSVSAGGISFKTGTSAGYTNATERLLIDTSGRVLIGTTTEGQQNADDLTVATSGNTGITIRSGNTSNGVIQFSDATSGNGEYAGFVDYDHNTNLLKFGTASTTRLSITNDGTVDIEGNLDVGAGIDVTGSITASSTGDASLILDAGTGGAGGNQLSYIDFKNNGTVKGNIAIHEGVSGIPLELNSAGGTGAVHLFHSGSKKFETTSGGATVTGDLTINGDASVDDLIQIGDDVKIEDYNAANSFRVKGVQDGNKGFIAFGSQTKQLGCNGSSAALTYDGNEVLTSASTVTATNVVGVANSSNTAYRVPFLSANTGTAAVYTDTSSGITYNPSTNTLAAVNFSGNGSSVTNVNATTLDSIDSGSFLRSDADDVASKRIRFSNNQTDNMDTIATSSGSHGCIEIYNQGSGNDAFMAFHTGSDFAFYFGLDADSNKLAVGGWSMGANKYAIYHEGNNPSYNDLSNKPTIPTNNNQLSNGAGYITSVSGQNYNSLSNKPTIPTNNNQLSNGSGYITSGSNRAAQAWVNFRGTSSVTKRDDVNVTTVGDNGTGNYTVNFSSSMPNDDYCIAIGYLTSAGNANAAKVISQSTGSFQIRTGSFQDGSGNNNRDFEAVYCAVFAG